jgi:hypothetical protein
MVWLWPVVIENNELRHFSATFGEVQRFSAIGRDFRSNVIAKAFRGQDWVRLITNLILREGWMRGVSSWAPRFRVSSWRRTRRPQSPSESIPLR